MRSPIICKKGNNNKILPRKSNKYSRTKSQYTS